MIDPGRLRRALFLDLERVDTDVYRVFGGASAHIVSLDHGCDCADHNWRGQENCKHVLRVLLDQGDRHVIEALRMLVDVPTVVRQRRRAA